MVSSINEASRLLSVSFLTIFVLFHVTAEASNFQPPPLPFDGGSGALTPWGGPKPDKRRIEAHLANAASLAMNENWSRHPTPSDVIVAIPVKLIAVGINAHTAFNQNGDGQINSTIGFERWSKNGFDTSFAPPLVASLVRFSDPQQPEQGLVSFKLAPGSFQSGAVMTIQFATEAGNLTEVHIPIPDGDLTKPATVDWVLPNEFSLKSLTERKILLVSLDSKISWYPIWFRMPIRTIGNLTAPDQSAADAFMQTVPPEFSHYRDQHMHSILDHEEVGIPFHPQLQKFPIEMLLEKQAHGFSIPYGIHFNKPGLHDKVPALPDRPVDLKDPSTYKVVGVGQFWNWTPFSDLAHLLQPLSVHYLCLDKRDPLLEGPDQTVQKDHGVITGANWHRVHLEFQEGQGVKVPLGAAESFLNNLENRSLFVGFGTAHPFVELPPGQFAWANDNASPDSGLSDVVTFRFLRPGEMFVTPNSGVAYSIAGVEVDQSVFHTVLSYQQDAPTCVEVWTPPCTPDDSLDFKCAQSNVTLNVTLPDIGFGNKLVFKGLSRFAINVDGKPNFHSDAVSTKDSNNEPIDMHWVSSTNGKSLWQAQLNLPQSTWIRYQIFKSSAAGSKEIFSGDFAVPVGPRSELKVNITK